MLPLPVFLGNHHAKMPAGRHHPKGVDIGCLVRRVVWLDTGHQVVPEKVPVDSALRTPSLGTASKLAVEATGISKIDDGNGQMERAQGHDVRSLRFGTE